MNIMTINTLNNVYSEKLIWKSIGRKWITDRIEHPLSSMLTLPLNLLDPFYQRFIYLPFLEIQTAGSSKKWVEQYLNEEEINIVVPSNVCLAEVHSPLSPTGEI